MDGRACSIAVRVGVVRGGCGAGWVWCGVDVVRGGCGAGWVWCGVGVVRGGCGAGWVWCGVGVVRGGCGAEWVWCGVGVVRMHPMPTRTTSATAVKKVPTLGRGARGAG